VPGSKTTDHRGSTVAPRNHQQKYGPAKIIGKGEGTNDRVYEGWERRDTGDGEDYPVNKDAGRREGEDDVSRKRENQEA